MKTQVKAVLVVPDDPNLSQPMAVPIRTEAGDLMSKRLLHFLEDGKVVFMTRVLSREIRDEVVRRFESVESWKKELIELKCYSDYEILKDMMAECDRMTELISRGRNDEGGPCNPVNVSHLGLACLSLIKKLESEIKELEIVKMYMFDNQMKV